MSTKTGKNPPFKDSFHPSLSFVVAAVAKAQAASKAAVTSDSKTARSARRLRSSASFHLPKTLKLPRQPKYARTAIARRGAKLDHQAILRQPLNTESAMRQIENHNTLVFLCDVRANKFQIKAAVKALYEIDVAQVNTLIRPDGLKKAFVRLSPNVDALEAAGKIGFI